MSDDNPETIYVSYQSEDFIQNGMYTEFSKWLDATYTPQDAGYQEIIEILRKYSYHNQLLTLVPQTTPFYSGAGTINLDLVWRDNVKVIAVYSDSIAFVDYTRYQVGYFGNGKSTRLINELAAVIGVE